MTSVEITKKFLACRIIIIIIIIIIICPWYLIPKGLRNYASEISWCDWLRNHG